PAAWWDLAGLGTVARAGPGRGGGRGRGPRWRRSRRPPPRNWLTASARPATARAWAGRVVTRVVVVSHQRREFLPVLGGRRPAPSWAAAGVLGPGGCLEGLRELIRGVSRHVSSSRPRSPWGTGGGPWPRRRPAVGDGCGSTARRWGGPPPPPAPAWSAPLRCHPGSGGSPSTGSPRPGRTSRDLR